MITAISLCRHPRRQSSRLITPFTDGRHHAEVGIIVYAKTCWGW